MFLLMAVGVIAIWTFHDGGKVTKQTKFFSFDEDDLIINVEVVSEYNTLKTLSGTLGGVVFTGNAGTPRQPELCKRKVKKGYNHCLYWDEGTMLKVKLLKFENGAQCYSFYWTNISIIIPQDCYILKYSDWYGMLSFSSPMWPINDNISTSVYSPGLNRKRGNVPQYYWLSTGGSAIYITQDSPVQLSWNSSENNKKLCLSPFVNNYRDSLSSFNYSVCQGMTMKEAHESVTKKFFSHLPTGSNRTLGNITTFDPNWKFGNRNSAFNKTDLKQFVAKLNQNGFHSGTIQIESRLEQEYGDLIFKSFIDKSDFTDLSNVLKDFKSAISIRPVCSMFSDAFNYGIKNEMFIKDSGKNVVKLIKFDESTVALWDIFNVTTREWLKSSILNLTDKMSVKNLKLVAIDTSLLTVDDQMTSIGSRFYQQWSILLSEITDMPILQSTFRSQNVPSYIEVNTHIVGTDKQCLFNTIPATLTYGLFGYSFIISNLDVKSNVSDELLIRWFQMSVFLSTFTIPSDFLDRKQNTVDYIRNISDFHQEMIYPRLQNLVPDVSESNPLIKPLWWIDDTDEKTYGINDEFLYGEDMLVAPVLCSGLRGRDIYLPDGMWLHTSTNVIYPGKQWLKDFPTGLYEIAYFILQDQGNGKNGNYYI